jgi:uncharacterized protein YjbJ (UPF0337 family)
VNPQAQGETTMNKDQVTGKVEQAAGRVKQGVGEAVGNQKLANQGVADQVKGAAKETWGNVKDSASEATATAKTHARETEGRAHEKNSGLRDKVTTAAQNVKHTIADKLDNFNKSQEEKREDIRKAS